MTEEQPQLFQRPDGAWIDPNEQLKCQPGKLIGVESFITQNGTCVLTHKGNTRNFTCPTENDQGRYVSMVISFENRYLGEDINALLTVIDADADENDRVTEALYNESCHGRRLLITKESFAKSLTKSERDEVKTIMKLDEKQLEELLKKLDSIELPVVIKREKYRTDISSSITEDGICTLIVGTNTSTFECRTDNQHGTFVSIVAAMRNDGADWNEKKINSALRKTQVREEQHGRGRFLRAQLP